MRVEASGGKKIGISGDGLLTDNTRKLPAMDIRWLMANPDMEIDLGEEVEAQMAVGLALSLLRTALS